MTDDNRTEIDHPGLVFKGLIFDMDGTLTRPILDFDQIRREIGIVGSGDLAHVIGAMPEEGQSRAWAVVEAHERRATLKQTLQPGAKELLAACRSAGIRVGILTRNVRESVDCLCEKYGLVLDAVVTREFPHIKPHPGPVLHILEEWGLESKQVMVIGDYIHDIECGKAAGTYTCFFQNSGKPDYGQTADYVVFSMAELQRIIFYA